MLETILSNCNTRHMSKECTEDSGCSYNEYCCHNCGKCLDYIHNPDHAPVGAPPRKYDCQNMADYYTCKYSCRYTSEIIYAINRCKNLKSLTEMKVLSFGCGPCTDLFAIDYLRSNEILTFKKLEYRGVDYSEEVWKRIHNDINGFETDNLKIKFYYQDACELINTIALGSWVPNLIVFQYVFSDMEKHSDNIAIQSFINTFVQYYNEKVNNNAYIVLNDINLGRGYGGGREYYDILYNRLDNSNMRKGRFRNDNATSSYYPYGYPYGDDSDGEFPSNENKFDYSPWQHYSPFNTCASAQMLICKTGSET